MSNSINFAFKNNHAGFTINSILKEVRLEVEDKIEACKNNTDE